VAYFTHLEPVEMNPGRVELRNNGVQFEVTVSVNVSRRSSYVD
jgi:hypothetical protein